jgi:DNA-directed RNA polymerase specialized sigma subunit
VSNRYNAAFVAALHRKTKSKTRTADENAELYRRVAAGDEAARDEMITGNVPLVISKVESFLRCFPYLAHLRDDLVSAGCVGLVRAVNQMARGCRIKKPENWNPTDHMGSAIYRKFGELIEDESTIRVPHTSKDRARAEGEELTVPGVINKRCERLEMPSHEEEFETRDVIETCCTSQEEKRFVAMRKSGHTLAEISAALGMSRMSVHRMGRRLEGRVVRKLEALRDA